MTHEASPFQSPLPEVTAGQPRLVEQPYVWLVIAAILCHVVTYVLVCFVSSLAEQLLIDVGPDPAAWVDPTFHVLSLVLLVMAPATFMLGFAAAFLLWQQWDNWRGAAIVALLALIPVFTLVVLGYVLLRARHELVNPPLSGEV